MSSPPKYQFYWQYDGDAFTSQNEHVEHVKWADQASNEPPRSSLGDDAMDYAWEGSGNGSSMSDISNWKDPRRLIRSDVMDELSSLWFGIDGFRDDGIEADARFLGLIDEHESSQHQERQPDTAESSQHARPAAHTSSTQQPCDHAPIPAQGASDRKDARTNSKPTTRSKAIHVPMLPATATPISFDFELGDCRTDGDPFQAKKSESESDSTSQEKFEIPSTDAVGDADFDSPEMQQYLLDLHKQEELERVANTGLDERRHSSMEVDCPRSSTSHPSDSREDIPDPGQHEQPSVSGEAGSSGEDPRPDQQSPSDQVPSLVTGSTAESTPSSTPAKESKTQSSSGQLNLRGGDPNDGLSTYVGGILAAVKSPDNSFQSVSSAPSLSKTACTSRVQTSADEYDPFYPSAPHSFTNTPTSRAIGFRANPAVYRFSETDRHNFPQISNEINYYGYPPLCSSAHFDSQRLPISKRSRFSKRRKLTHSGSPPFFQQSSLLGSPSCFASEITTSTRHAQALANDGSEFKQPRRSPVPPVSQNYMKTLGTARLDSHPTPSTTTFSPCAATASPRSKKESDEMVIQKLEEMSRIIVADQRAKAEMAMQNMETQDQQADLLEVDSARGWRQQEQQNPKEEFMDEKTPRLADARERVRGDLVGEAEYHATGPRTSI